VDHLALLEGEVAAMAAALRAADPARPVDSCPDWTVQDLTNHLCAVHRWVLLALRNEGSPAYDESVPSTADDYAAVSSDLVRQLRALPPEAPCWTFHPDDRTTSFWRRRQLQEVSIHRWDVDQHALDPLVAADGVSEVVDFFLPRMLSRGRTTVPAGTLTLDDGARTWTLTASDGPTATVSGSTHDLNLALWGRQAPDALKVEGDEAFAAAVFAAALTP
jgi:uncharacterized protein (TIGR03083 family)